MKKKVVAKEEEEVKEADIRLTREDAYIIIEGLKKTTLADGVMVKDLPPLLTRIHQVIKKVADPFVEVSKKEKERGE